MWLSRQQKQEPVQPPGGTGEVTLSGDVLAVELESERRRLEVYGPGGLRWKPAVGQKVLVLKAEGDPCVTGARTDSSGLEPGELALESAGGAAVRLDNAGRVALDGRVEVDGSFYLNGRELTELIREIAAQVAGAMLGG